jgi:hypothetical protein
MGACRDNGSIRPGKRKKLQLIGHRGNEFYGRRKEMCILPRSRAHMRPLRHFDIKYRCTDENLKSIVTTFGNANSQNSLIRDAHRSPCSARHMLQSSRTNKRAMAHFKDPLWSNENYRTSTFVNLLHGSSPDGTNTGVVVPRVLNITSCKIVKIPPIECGLRERIVHDGAVFFLLTRSSISSVYLVPQAGHS